MIAMVASIGGVEIHREVRVVVGIESNQRAGFGSVQLHLVPVQVKSLSIGSLSHPADGPVLPSAVVEAHPFISISVEEGDDEKDQRVLPGRVFSSGELP